MVVVVFVVLKGWVVLRLVLVVQRQQAKDSERFR